MLLVLGFFAAGLVQSIVLRTYFFTCFRTGLQLRSAVISTVYRTVLSIAPSALQTAGFNATKSNKTTKKKTKDDNDGVGMSTGYITNLISVDAQRMQDLTPDLQVSKDAF